MTMPGPMRAGTHGALPAGAIDMHVHAMPDVRPRLLDARAAALAAERAGMAGIVLTDHFLPTTDRAYLLSQSLGRLRVYGTVVLNRSMGGINPLAVEAALGHGVSMVSFPTLDAAQWLRALGSDRPGLTVFGENGRLLPAVHDVLEVLAGSAAVLNTGHLAPEESLALIREARGHGVERILVGHATNPAIGMTLEEQLEAARLGAFIEHVYVLAAPQTTFRAPLTDILGHAKQVGAEACVLSSDLGQVGNPPPVEGLADFAQTARRFGFSEEEVETMLVRNPGRLLATS